MGLRNITLFATSLFFATWVAGCSAAYTRAAAAYADANSASTDAISTTRSTAADMCLKKARLRYLDGRLKEDEKIDPWNDFFTKKGNATTALSWQEYCQELDKTAELFGLGVAALSDYGAALGALARTGAYDGSNIKDIGDHASSIAGSLGAAEGPAAAIKPAGSIVGSLSAFLFNAVSDHKIKDYVIRADPMVQSLLKALEAYVEALKITLTTTDDARKVVIKNAEKGVITPPMDTTKVVQFFQFASSVDDDARRAKQTLDGYIAVMKKMAEAHTKLVNASSDSGTDDDVKNVLGATADLLEQVNTLRPVLTKKE
jgi:hypothetical protein